MPLMKHFWKRRQPKTVQLPRKRHRNRISIPLKHSWKRRQPKTVQLPRKGELDIVTQEWNNHRIAPSRNRLGPFGRPSVMQTMPQLYATEDFMVPVPQNEIELCRTECVFKGQYPCDRDVFDLCTIMMAEMQLSVPSNCEEGRQLYVTLRTTIVDEL